jgi:hypothetical protein
MSGDSPPHRSRGVIVDRHLPFALSRQAPQVLVQFRLLALGIVADADPPVVPGPHQVMTLVDLFIVQKLEGRAATVADIDPQPAGRRGLQRLDAADPQQTRARVPLAGLGHGLVGGDGVTDVQELVDQAEDPAVTRRDGQAVVALVAAAAVAGDQPQVVVQGRMAGEVQCGGVVDEEHDALIGVELGEGGLAVRGEDGGMGDGRMVHQVVAAAQGVGVGEFLGQAALRVVRQAVGEIDQGAGAAAVAELGRAKVLLAKVIERNGGSRHGVDP